MSDDDQTQLGLRWIWGEKHPFGIRRGDRRHHLYAVGKTGAGKTTLLRNMIVSDIAAGDGVGLIDPHGDLAQEILDYIPPWRTDDVVYFNPADYEWPIGLNLLQGVPAERRHLAASGVVSVFKSIWRDSWGPRLEYILYAAIAALLECQNVSLLGVPRMLSDKKYRAWVLRQVKDPVVHAFWEIEFEGYSRQFVSEAVAPIQNKVGQLLMSPPVRNILGQVRSRFSPRFIMDKRRIFIANLSKGQLGADKSNLLGALLVAQFQLAAMSRADIREEERPDFFLYIDEFHNFSTDSFVGILSEARKYRLCLTLAHQYVQQLRDQVRDAVLGNAGTIVAFRVGSADANILEREFAGAYDARHFTELANYSVAVKLLANGDYGNPILGETVPPLGERYRKAKTIIVHSRERYASDRRLVEEKVSRWLRR